MRDIGTTAADDIVDIVIGQGKSFDAEIDLHGVPHHAYYFPLVGWDGSPVGMFFIGFPTEQAISDTNALLSYLIMIGTIGLVVAATVMMLIISISASKVSRLAEIVGDITASKANVGMSSVQTSNDEAGVLTHNITTLVGTINKLSDILGDMAHGNLSVKYHQEPCAPNEWKDRVGKRTWKRVCLYRTLATRQGGL